MVSSRIMDDGEFVNIERWRRFEVQSMEESKGFRFQSMDEKEL